MPQQKIVNGSRAAQIIGITYKTLIKRYDEGWIVGERTAQGKYKFTLDEVERAKVAWEEEHPQFASSTDLNPSTSLLEDRITDLEVEVKLLHDRLAKIEQAQIILPQIPPLRDDLKPWGPNAIPVTTTTKNPLPEGCVLATKFAEQHGVLRSTIREHLDKGKIAFDSRPKPGREGETERYFTPEQQEEALAYWRKRGLI
jgi:hypothetical protein